MPKIGPPVGRKRAIPRRRGRAGPPILTEVFDLTDDTAACATRRADTRPNQARQYLQGNGTPAVELRAGLRAAVTRI